MALVQITNRPMALSTAQTRSFAFLQGVCSPFFAQLGVRLAEEGVAVSKVNFTAGDASSWPGRLHHVSYRGQLEALDDFSASYFDERSEEHTSELQSLMRISS